MSISHVDGQEILKEIQANDSVLIDCWAPWCPPCRMIGAVLEEIDLEVNLEMVKVNADENEDFISEYQVLGLPTLLLFKNGKLVSRIIGYQPKSALIESLASYGLIK